MQVVARPQLSRELIARTALELTRQSGLSVLSMRKLGGELGVEAMSLYHYIDNKADLLDAMLECLFADIELPRDAPVEDWELGMRRGMSAFRTVLVGHRAAAELFASRPATGEHALEVLSWSIDRLVAVGLDAVRATHALHFASSFVIGHVAHELGVHAVSRDPQRRAELGASGAPAAEFMKTARSISAAEMFDSGLDALVAGLRSHYHLP